MIRVYCYAKEFFWQIVALGIVGVLIALPPPAKAPVPEVTHYCPDAQTAYESWAPCDAHSSPVETEI